jgi:hypothetical protein
MDAFSVSNMTIKLPFDDFLEALPIASGKDYILLPTQTALGFGKQLLAYRNDYYSFDSPPHVSKTCTLFNDISIAFDKKFGVRLLFGQFGQARAAAARP